MNITKDMLIAEILKAKPESAEILLKNGMGCIGCPASQMESLEQAAMVHGLDLEKLMNELNA
jgi:hybrid cluster-associated redox disulfide protein